MEQKEVIDLYATLKTAGIRIWVDGGWGVDALLGRQTRQHKDLDITIQKKDIPQFRIIVEERGYRETKLDIAQPHNFVLADEHNLEIDVHVIELDEYGN